MIADDVDDFFVVGEFAEMLIVAGEEVECIADAPVDEADLGGIEADLEQAVVTVRERDMSSIPDGTVVTFRGASYVAYRGRSDGAGLATVRLVAEQATAPAQGVWR